MEWKRIIELVFIVEDIFYRFLLVFFEVLIVFIVLLLIILCMFVVYLLFVSYFNCFIVYGLELDEY